jgi:hypothetical protein
VNSRNSTGYFLSTYQCKFSPFILIVYTYSFLGLINVSPEINIIIFGLSGFGFSGSLIRVPTNPISASSSSLLE